MPIADWPQSAERRAFHQRLQEIIAGHEDPPEEDDGTGPDLEMGPAAGGPPRAPQEVFERGDPRGRPQGAVAVAMAAGEAGGGKTSEFVPLLPGSLPELGMRSADIEAIVLKFLLNNGPHTGFEIGKHIGLPLTLITELLHQLKDEMLLSYKSGAAAGDFVYELTELGSGRARRYWDHCTYFGTVPVAVKDYIASVQAQSVRKQNPKIREIQRALDGLSIPPEMIVRLAQAVNSGLALFLYGAPGNGKTTIACRLTGAFGETVWIPRAVSLGGSIMRVYDPNNHVVQPLSAEARGRTSGIDDRWVRIRRPTIAVGGELTLESFDVRTNQTTGVSEAPIQLKSNCGTLVIDDFGRQRVTPAEILNRWIVPLAKGWDILHLRNGRTFEVPIDQLIVFSTNLEPRTLVDEAFLRRIPYKIDVGNPSEQAFRSLLKKIAEEWKVAYEDGPVDYLIERYYKDGNREMRYCHPGDILQQVCTFCKVLELPLALTDEAIDAAAKNYFALL